jgi:hypothetical protein
MGTTVYVDPFTGERTPRQVDHDEFPGYKVKRLIGTDDDGQLI